MVNPYLSHAAILAAIADGLERSARPGAAAEPQFLRPGGGGRRPGRGGFARLPRTLGEALSALAADRVVRDALPPPLYDAFAAAKTDEWERFCGTVTEWHREMYLQAIP